MELYVSKHGKPEEFYACFNGNKKEFEDLKLVLDHYKIDYTYQDDTLDGIGDGCEECDAQADECEYFVYLKGSR